MKAVGSIQYMAAVTRPDIAYAAHTLARHMARSATKHWLAVQHVMRYLQSTIDVVLTFNGSGNEGVVDVYSDADFAYGLWFRAVELESNRRLTNDFSKRCCLVDLLRGVFKV